MANLSKVHKDDKGLFIRTGGYVFRPGGIIGCDHAYDMSDGDLKEGDYVKARHMSGTELCRIKLADRVLVWGSESAHERDKQWRK